jgi:hypothetical protein
MPLIIVDMENRTHDSLIHPSLAADHVEPASSTSRTRFAIAFGVAAISDAASFATEFVPPIQWAVDLTTSALLFLVLGRRWAILPGLIAEAIPGLAAFPVWILVVLSILLYDHTGKKNYAAI